MAYLYRKRGYWYVAYRTPEGWKRKSLKTKKKGEAEGALPQFRRRETAEDAPPVSRISLPDFCSYYREHRRQQLSEKAYDSQEKYRLPLFARFLEGQGVAELDGVRPSHIEAYVRHRQDHVSPATIKSDLFLIKHMLQTAVAWGFLSENPAGDIRPPRVADTRKSRALTEDEVEALLLAAEGSPTRPLIATAALAGLRRGELINLEWKDIDWRAGFINVQNKKGKRAFTTKSGRNRRVPVHRRLRAILWPLRGEDGYCFLTVNGLKWNGSNLRRAFGRIVEKAEIDPERVNLHALRHTFLTMLTSRSSNLPAAQKMAGHARLATTMRYVHVEDEVLSLEMAKWE